MEAFPKGCFGKKNAHYGLNLPNFKKKKIFTDEIILFCGADNCLNLGLRSLWLKILSACCPRPANNCYRKIMSSRVDVHDYFFYFIGAAEMLITRPKTRPLDSVSRRGQTLEKPYFGRNGQKNNCGGQKVFRSGRKISRGGRKTSRGGQKVNRGGRKVSRDGQKSSCGGQKISRGGQKISCGVRKSSHVMVKKLVVAVEKLGAAVEKLVASWLENSKSIHKVQV